MTTIEELLLQLAEALLKVFKVCNVKNGFRHVNLNDMSSLLMEPHSDGSDGEECHLAKLQHRKCFKGS